MPNNKELAKELRNVIQQAEEVQRNMPTFARAMVESICVWVNANYSVTRRDRPDLITNDELVSAALAVWEEELERAQKR